MEDKEYSKKVLILLIVHIVLMALALDVAAHGLINIVNINEPMRLWLIRIGYFVCIFALIVGILYFITGYKKAAYKYYRTFMYSFGVITMISIALRMVFMKCTLLVALLEMLLLSSIVILATGKDLGVKKSKTISLSMIIYSLALFVITWLDSGFFDTNLVYQNVVRVMLSTTTFLMVLGKYYDKKQRGSK